MGGEATPRKTRLWFILVALILLAFTIRVYHLGASSLRGDEAFAVRYWAAPPAAVLRQLAWIEPHPFGTFFGFWLWKSLAGDSEFAMRLLPTLVNLLGVPALFGIGRRLFHRSQIGLAAALLWAINPDLVWHSQDARNYAIWAGISAVSVWLLLRAADRSRRVDWVLYSLVTTLGLYVFFLEVFMVVVHGLYILIDRRKAWRAWLFSLLIIGVLLIPWLGQLWALAHSGYKGTAVGADVRLLITQFWQTLAFGEPFVNHVNPVLLVIPFALFILSLILLHRRNRQAGTLLILWLVVPTLLLLIAATRVNVFEPRYLIAVTPAVILPLAWVVLPLFKRWPHPLPPSPLRSEGEPDPATPLSACGEGWGGAANRKRWRVGRGVLVGVIVIFTSGGLLANAAYHKAPDWRALRDYLRTYATADDTVIMTSLDPQVGNIDPAFEYYYNGPAQITPLPHPKYDTKQVVQQALQERRAVWFVLAGYYTDPINEALLANGMLITDEKAGPDFPVRQYWSRDVKPGEIAVPLNLHMGGATLRGYRLVGEPRTGSQLTILLYWEGKPAPNLTTFVHLVGAPQADGSPLWTQQDHPPQAPGRDLYALDLAAVPAGSYTILVGLYDPRTNTRVSIVDGQSNTPIGDAATLRQLAVR
ncbi:MAG: glycosyltransferase family 39 protein [Anaerolineae bacterium]|nr:glycosyltransferase family 39 protein [Anaerolineae bacterium]